VQSLEAVKTGLSCCLILALMDTMGVTLACAAAGVEAKAGAALAPRVISFAGHNWIVKTSAGRVGPGPNYFSDNTNNIWVDTSGRLHLKITRHNGRWYCAEIISNDSFGFGTYRFYLDTPVDSLDPHVVLGLFTWSDDPAYNNREIDIEFSRWGIVANQNAQYVVQPYNVAGNQYRFEEPPNLYQTTHSFDWTSTSVFSESLIGHLRTPTDPSQIIAQHTFTQGIPQAGGENARMNLWLFQGQAPTDRQEVEVIVSWFEFVP